MKKLSKNITITAIASLVAAGGLAFAQQKETNPGDIGAKEPTSTTSSPTPTLQERLNDSGSSGSRNAFPAPVAAPVEQQAAPVAAEPAPAAQPTITEAPSAAEPSTAAAPVAEERAPQADRN